MNILTISDLSKSFNNQQIINNLNLHIPAGTIFGTLSVKQTHFNTWFKQWKCPEQSIKESIQSITSSLASPIEPLVQ